MESYGKAITALRKKNGMTQAELGNALNVTYQAVSKWENDLSQPSIDVIADICKIFNISIDEFIKMARNEEIVETATTSDNTLSREETAQVIREELARAEEEKAKVIREKQRKQEMIEQEVQRRERRTEALWFRAGAIISIVVALIVFLPCAFSGDVDALLGGLILAYGIIAFGSQLGHDCVVTDIFVGGWEWSLGMPGVIFSFDLDGILFLILYKWIIAPIISFVVGLVVGLGGTLLAMICSMFTFPFKIPSIIRDMKY